MLWYFSFYYVCSLSLSEVGLQITENINAKNFKAMLVLWLYYLHILATGNSLSVDGKIISSGSELL